MSFLSVSSAVRVLAILSAIPLGNTDASPNVGAPVCPVSPGSASPFSPLLCIAPDLDPTPDTNRALEAQRLAQQKANLDLLAAGKLGNYGLFIKALDSGADPSYYDVNGWNAFHEIARKVSNTDLMVSLHLFYSDLNEEDEFVTSVKSAINHFNTAGNTPLDIVAGGRGTVLMNRLLWLGADTSDNLVGKATEELWTAIENQDLKAFSYLLEQPSISLEPMPTFVSDSNKRLWTPLQYVTHLIESDQKDLPSMARPLVLEDMKTKLLFKQNQANQAILAESKKEDGSFEEALNRGAQLDCKAKNGWNIFHAMATQGYIDSLNRIVALSSQFRQEDALKRAINQPDNQGRTPLDIAIERNKTSVERSLSDLGGKMNQQIKYEVLEKKRIDGTLTDSEEVALKSLKKQATKELWRCVNNRIDKSIKSKSNLSSGIDNIKRALSMGADPNAMNEHSEHSCFQFAAQVSPFDEDLLDALVRGGADINLSCNYNSVSPLFSAIRDARGDLFDYLLEQPSVFLGKRELPALKGPKESFTPIQYIDKILERNENSVLFSKDRPLLKDMKNKLLFKHTKANEALLAAGNLSDSDSLAALESALRLGAELDYQDPKGWNYFHEVAQAGDRLWQDISILVSQFNQEDALKRAINIFDNQGRTLLDIAMDEGHDSVASRLKMLGAKTSNEIYLEWLFSFLPVGVRVSGIILSLSILAKLGFDSFKSRRLEEERAEILAGRNITEELYAQWEESATMPKGLEALPQLFDECMDLKDKSLAEIRVFAVDHQEQLAISYNGERLSSTLFSTLIHHASKIDSLTPHQEQAYNDLISQCFKNHAVIKEDEDLQGMMKGLDGRTLGSSLALSCPLSGQVFKPGQVLFETGGHWVPVEALKTWYYNVSLGKMGLQRNSCMSALTRAGNLGEFNEIPHLINRYEAACNLEVQFFLDPVERGRAMPRITSRSLDKASRSLSHVSVGETTETRTQRDRIERLNAEQEVRVIHHEYKGHLVSGGPLSSSLQHCFRRGLNITEALYEKWNKNSTVPEGLDTLPQLFDECRALNSKSLAEISDFADMHQDQLLISYKGKRLSTWLFSSLIDTLCSKAETREAMTENDTEIYNRLISKCFENDASLTLATDNPGRDDMNQRLADLHEAFPDILLWDSITYEPFHVDDVLVRQSNRSANSPIWVTNKSLSNYFKGQSDNIAAARLALENNLKEFKERLIKFSRLSLEEQRAGLEHYRVLIHNIQFIHDNLANISPLINYLPLVANYIYDKDDQLTSAYVAAASISQVHVHQDQTRWERALQNYFHGILQRVQNV